MSKIEQYCCVLSNLNGILLKCSMMLMKGKRITILIMEVLAALMGILSAVGGSCPAFNPARILELEPGETLTESSIALHAVMSQYQWAFIILNILTYIAAVGTMLMIWALAKRKKWFYTTALGIAILGCVSGLIPYYLVTLNGGSTPSNMRAIIYGAVILLLLIPGFRKDLKGNIAMDKQIENNTADNTLSALFFFPGILIWVQSLFAAPSHVLGNNVEMFQALQIGVGLVLTAMGILLFSVSQIKNHRT